MWNKIKPYILPYSVAIAIPLAVGTLSALITKDNMQIYQQVKSPPLSPPGWLFPIVWTVLYVIMGVSSAMIYLRRAENPKVAKNGLTYYVMSLIANFGWSIIFFNMQLFGFAFVWLLMLLYFIVRTIISYRKLVPVAAYLQIPYAVWVAFAGYLNIGIYLLN